MAIQKELPNAKIELTENDEDVRDYNVSFEKIKRSLNFTTEITLEQGIQSIIKEFEKGRFEDYNDRIYSNYLSLT